MRLLTIGAGCIAALALASPAFAAGGLRTVTVDASKQVGTIRNLQGVSSTPLAGDGSRPDLTAQQHELGVDFVRTHDIDCSGTGDIDGLGVNRIFPDPTADPNDPASYNFGPTDTAILSAARAGEEIEFNLGHSDLSRCNPNFNNTPPADPARYATVARNVARHYNDGWDGGYHLGIRYWEIWNEPDLTPFWGGTSQQFYDLYADTARALKSLHPWMQVGGVALTTNNDLRGYRESLLAYVRDNHLPLDFWSIHHYSDFTEDPLDFTRLAQEHRALLDSYGFTNVPIHLNEWNYGLVDQPSSIQRATYAADSLVLMQDSPIQRAAFYRMDAGGDFGLVNPDGSLTKTGEAFKAVGSLLHTPQRVATTGGDNVGFAVEAGRSHPAGAVRVLIANYEIPPQDMGPLPFPDNLFTIPGIATFKILDRRTVTYQDNNGYDLTVNGLPGEGRPYRVKRYRLDANNDLTLISDHVQRGGPVRLTATLPAPSVELVSIKPLNGD